MIVHVCFNEIQQIDQCYAVEQVVIQIVHLFCLDQFNFLVDRFFLVELSLSCRVPEKPFQVYHLSLFATNFVPIPDNLVGVVLKS